jgi:formamidopyrimidine-DNA glycosylase
MPERPDLEHVVPALREALAGRTLERARIQKPLVLRAPLGLELLFGASLAEVSRAGHFVVLGFGGWTVAINLMLAGRLSVLHTHTRTTADVAVVLEFGEWELRIRDEQQMAKVYVVRSLAEVPGLLPVGADVLADDFTVDTLAKLAKGHREQVKVWLMDKHVFDSFGNAYADETLWEAGLHPKATAATLSPAELERLHRAMRTVLGGAIEEIQRRNPPIDEKLRDFLKVRNRGGEPCPRCGDKLRAAGVRGHDAFFCPTCQPDTAGKGFVGWRR